MSEIFPQNQVIRLIAQADKREFVLFLGAGASKSSGVPLASEMIQEWRQMTFNDQTLPNITFEKWCQQQSWYNQEDEYSLLFEKLFPDQRARQKYVEPKIENAFPSWGYLYLANIIQSGFFNVIFTTNFDDLINEALTMFLGYNPVVCSADSEVASINITTERAKIIKLHGDYLFKKLKNTREELIELDPNMEKKFKEFTQHCGLLVIGYRGNDQSIMKVIEKQLKDPTFFPRSIYWGKRSGDALPLRVQNLVKDYPGRFFLFDCLDFDSFMAQLHSACQLNLPRTILHPYDTLRERYQRLVSTATGYISDKLISQHRQVLEKELERSWAKTTDVNLFDLMEAQMALGRRDYKSAIEFISKYVHSKPDDADGLATWGDALAIKAEEEGSESTFREAEVKWKQAVEKDPKKLQPHYSLLRYYTQKQKYPESIVEAEALIALSPNDHMLRRNLIQLYTATNQHDEAEKQLDWLLQKNPQSTELHMMRASVLERCGLLDEAVSEIREALKLDAQNAACHFTLANNLVRMSMVDDSEYEFKRAIQLDPTNLAYRLQIANFYWMLQQPLKAVPHIEEALKFQPDSAELHGWLGQLYSAIGRFTEALRETEAALELSPQDIRLRINIGTIYINLNRLDVAESTLKNAVQLNPKIPQPYYWLCILYRKQNRIQELGWSLQSLRQIAPQIAQMIEMYLMNPTMNWEALMQMQSEPWLQNETSPKLS